ncbi:cupin domain-containing protein [Leptobacterium flavescens]|uniref:Cupin domain-containing protein n=1 Tax=Leptobacterium flavescens TaxID=472055 RepID=A0A6P0UPE2_9FLAO|nr:cupin domain-containing protein [Leptobacterium flavescens]NER15204.1 cupin domain-containing protein [Leptobacterium flavescens]
MNLKETLQDVTEYFSPKIVGEVNNEYIKVAKIKGDKVPWHNHENEDELFYIVEGSLLMEIEGQDAFIMNKGDLFVVKKGVNHRVSSEEECAIMLIESKTTKHTGDVDSEITKTLDQQSY